jgi:hypothetical protein
MDERVIAYICTGTATAVTWKPTKAMPWPTNSRRKSG